MFRRILYLFCLIGFQEVFQSTSDLPSKSFANTIAYLENQNSRFFHSIISFNKDDWIEKNYEDSIDQNIQDYIFEQNRHYKQYIQIQNAKKILNLNKSRDAYKSSLYIFFEYEVFESFQEIFLKRYFKAETWLFINVYENKLMTNYSSETSFAKIWNKKEIRLDSQIYFLNGNESHASLFELYKPCHNSILQVRELANFYFSNTKYLASETIWNRRDRLDGCTLKVAYVDQPPLISKAKSSNDLVNAKHILESGNTTMIGGEYSHLEIIQRLSHDLKFSIEWVQAMDSSYGVFDNAKETWDGLIKLMMDGDSDFSNAYLTVTPSRSHVVSFTIGFDQTRYGLFMKKPSHHSTSWDTFISLLHPQYWFAIISISLLAVVSALILFYNVDIEYSNSSERHQKTTKFFDHFGSSIYSVLLALTTLDVFTEKIKRYCKRKSFKYFIFTLCLFGLVSKETYTGGLISSFINQKEGVNIKDIGDLAEKDDHQLLLFNGTASIQYFSEATDSPNKEIWEKHLKNKPDAYFSRIKPIEEKLLKSERYIYFEQIKVAQNFIENYPCKIIQSGQTYFHRSVGLGMRKDSEYLELFNLKILRYIETGVIANMDIFRTSEKAKSICKKENYQSVGYESLTSIFVMLTVASVLSKVICVYEIFSNYFYNMKNRDIELYVVKDE